MASNPQQSTVDREILGRVAGLQLRARHLAAGIVSGLHRSAYQGFSQEFVQHRNYTPGDDLRYVDWKLFGRSDRLVVRQYQQERNLRLILAVDCSESMLFRSPRSPMTKYEAGCTIAAAAAYIAMLQQDAVGLALLGSGIERLIEPSNRTGYWNTLTRILAERTPAGPADLAGNLRKLADRLTRPALIMLVSDLLGDSEAVVRNLAWFSRRDRELMVLHVMDPAELDLDAGPAARFEDMESEAWMNVDPPAVRKAYRQQVEQFVHKVSSTCAGLKADYELFDTSKPLHHGLVEMLSRRNARVH